MYYSILEGKNAPLLDKNFADPQDCWAFGIIVYRYLWCIRKMCLERIKPGSPKRLQNSNFAADFSGVAEKFLVFCIAAEKLCYESLYSNTVFSCSSHIFAGWPMDLCVGVLCGVYPQLCPVHRGCVHMGCICLRAWCSSRKNSYFCALEVSVSILGWSKMSHDGALGALRFASDE